MLVRGQARLRGILQASRARPTHSQFGAIRPQSSVPNPYSTKDSTFWTNETNQRDYLNWLSRQLGLRSQSDWHTVTPKDFKTHSGEQILQLYSHSIYQMMRKLYPEQDWKEWQFDGAFFRSRENRRRFWTELAKYKGYNSLADWYFLQKRDVEAFGGRKIFNAAGLGRRIAPIIMDDFPEHKWEGFKFEFGAKASDWKNQAHLREYLDFIGRSKLQIGDLSDWYNVKTSHFKTTLGANGKDILAHHGSLQAALRVAHPEHDWRPWLFAQVSSKYWNDPENIKSYFEWLSNRLQIQREQDWYSVSKKMIAAHSGAGLLRSKFNDSVQAALQQVFPNHEWLPWRFQHSAQRWWTVVENQRQFLDWSMKMLELESMDQWNNVTLQQVYDLGGEGLIKNQYGGSLMAALHAVYPEHPWNFSVII